MSITTYVAIIAFSLVLTAVGRFVNAMWCWHCSSIARQEIDTNSPATTKTKRCTNCGHETRYRYNWLAAVVVGDGWSRSGEVSPRETVTRESLGCLGVAILLGIVVGGVLGINLSPPGSEAIWGIVGLVLGGTLAGYLMIRSNRSYSKKP